MRARASTIIGATAVGEPAPSLVYLAFLAGILLGAFTVLGAVFLALILPI